MAIESCTSCSSNNLAVQYAEQLAERARSSRSVPEPNAPGESNNRFVANGPTQITGPTVNGLGETVGQLINATA